VAELNIKKFLLTVLALVALLPASAAKAHDPIILTPDQATPANTISFALYGALDSPKDTRGFRVNFKEGDPLYFSILIPDLGPENQLDDASLPFLEITDPAGTTTKLAVSEKVPFAEPYSGTNYFVLTQFNSVAIAGTYSVVVTGNSPSRFTVSFGQIEMFGTPVENIANRDLGVDGVMSWYENSPTQTSETQAPETQSNTPETAEQAEATENNQSSVLVIILVAAIVVAIAVAFKVSKKRNN
jgi:opacity protein-like surface antigen